MIEPPMSQQHHQHHHPQIANPSIRGLPVSSGHHKVVPSPSPTPDSNGYTHLRDKRDGTIAVVRDRKPLYGGSVTLSSPLPMPTDSNVVEEKENEEDDDETDKDENLYQFSDLLRRHVQRAKRIRARLNDERAKRIERYKTRLSLLLPPLEEESWNHYYAGN